MFEYDRNHTTTVVDKLMGTIKFLNHNFSLMTTDKFNNNIIINHTSYDKKKKVGVL